ncbi:MAG: hypothetical protein JW791_04835 [Nanoarchaeota archaeon]|nr:hypothetical protein [Nanoarchaeota archaeon]
MTFEKSTKSRSVCLNCSRSYTFRISETEIKADIYVKGLGVYILNQCDNSDCNALMLIHTFIEDGARSWSLVYGVTPSFHKNFPKIEVLPLMETCGLEDLCELKNLPENQVKKLKIHPVKFNLKKPSHQMLMSVIDYNEDNNELKAYQYTNNIAVFPQIITPLMQSFNQFINA